jgi:hypothetical protein
MGLAAAWRRQGAWATAVTLLVPGALTLAVFTVLLGGGFRGLGALGQVLTGPQVPEARLSASTVPARPPVARLPTVPVLRPADRVLAAPAPAPGTAGPGRAAPQSPVVTTRPRPTRPAASGAAPAPAAAQAPASRPAGSPASPVRQLGEQVATGVGAAPVVGPAGHDVVTRVLDTVAPPPPVP